MTELTFTLLRLGFLVLLWVFVLSAISVLRRDLYGTRVAQARKRRGPPAARAAPPEPMEAVPGARIVAPGTPPAKAVVISGPLRGMSVPLSGTPLVIGRAPQCALVLDDEYSSARHAQIFASDGAWYIEDLGSTNGTFVNDRRIDGITALGVGSVVRIGQSVVELQR